MSRSYGHKESRVDYEKIKAVLDRCTVLVFRTSVVLGETGPFDIKQMLNPGTAMASGQATAEGYEPVNYLGIAVGIKLRRARRNVRALTKLIEMPPPRADGIVWACDVAGALDPRQFDLGWKLRLVTFGVQVMDWRVHEYQPGVPSHREVLWQVQFGAFQPNYAHSSVANSHQAERDAAKAREMLKDKPKKDKDQLDPSAAPTPDGDSPAQA
jgi:hypothetical protein